MIKHIKTIGYASLGYDSALIIRELKNELKDGVLLVDVRQTPYGLVNKQDLKKELNFQYYSAMGFGNPNYQDVIKFKQQVDNLLKYAGERYHTIILMCAEADVNRCHRKEIAEKLSPILKADVEHLRQKSYSNEVMKDRKITDFTGDV